MKKILSIVTTGIMAFGLFTGSVAAKENKGNHYGWNNPHNPHYQSAATLQEDFLQYAVSLGLTVNVWVADSSIVGFNEVSMDYVNDADLENMPLLVNYINQKLGVETQVRVIQ
ncbi:hypothetical protein [Neobacillus niacini]|uniref:hypothetical protein n=1 Tax=Neobacillus niacini TaxID=86668 RepID=UPI00203CE170|nr:hypothetical protein [Neobacillus niacini]MCM3690968.1 hypothetical protein [Neobacillus niacini]